MNMFESVFIAVFVVTKHTFTKKASEHYSIIFSFAETDADELTDRLSKLKTLVSLFHFLYVLSKTISIQLMMFYITLIENELLNVKRQQPALMQFLLTNIPESTAAISNAMFKVRYSG